MKMTYVFGTGSITFNSEDSSTTQAALAKPVVKFLFWLRTNSFHKTFINSAMNLFLAVDIASNTFSAGVLADDGSTENTLVSMNYDPDWTFDSTSLISVCSDYDGSNKIACTVDNIKVAYSSYSSSVVVNTANSVTLLADYKLNDGVGSTTAVNSQIAAGSLGSATFCTL